MFTRLVRASVRCLLAAGGLLLRAVALALVVLGIPWALVYFVGNPIAAFDRSHSAGDAWAQLSQPLGDATLIYLLAAVAWVCWIGIVVNVLRELAWYAVHMPNLARRVGTRSAHEAHVEGLSAVRSMVAMLVGGMVLTLLRSSSASAMPVDGPMRAPGVVRTAVSTAYAGTPELSFEGRGTAPTSATTPYVVQRGDTLWDIAKQELGDPWRWPEIYQASKEVTQPDGSRLRNPDLIYPGWTLHLPTPQADPATDPPPSVDSPVEPPEATTPPVPPPNVPQPFVPPSSAPSAAPSAPSAPAAPPSAADHGFELPGGAYVGLGLVAAVAAAAATVRLRRRRRYKPGSGKRDDLAMEPIVRAMIGTHSLASSPTGPVGAGDAAKARSQDPQVASGARATATLAQTESQVGLALGILDGRSEALTIARRSGLSVLGPGAHDAIRALLANAVALASSSTHSPVQVGLTTSTAEELFGGTALGPPPPGLVIAESLRTVLDALDEAGGPPAQSAAGTLQAPPTTYLVAMPGEDDEDLLTETLSSPSRPTVLLLVRWPAVPEITVDAGGYVQAASASITRSVSGLRLFALGVTDTTDVLHLLREASPQIGPEPALPARRIAARGSGTGTAPPSGRRADEAPPQPPGPPNSGRGLGGSRPDATAPQPREPTQDGVSLELRLLGPRRLLLRDAGDVQDITAALAPKQHEILAYLAVHQDGATRAALGADLWPSAPTTRPYNSLHATLSQMRQAFRATTGERIDDVIMHRAGRYALDAERLAVDLWQVQADIELCRDTRATEDRHDIVERVIQSYRGHLAVDVTSEWAEAPREALRRDVLDTLSTHAHALQSAAPGDALALLEQARQLDPYNEALYTGIMRLQRRLGLLDHIPRTLALLTTALAEIEETPSPEVQHLSRQLRRPHDGEAAAS
ncbi:LysM peptidoglycan-binding domain-containing protein [Yinghuangia soli]|uniref:LysM peptidoglycan-binding domain-containing protein n=1 Tax=Yinghuangia soli TaxID=2908204 RepID=A0AA41U2Y3_9ACTN|nr:LysM peptidoglycan-binding domain-containing protein [Yinghuangia soli]MCF2531166.1 LysM peptidoglycan-binding domain-containing protein [Yinghuangia soli]